MLLDRIPPRRMFLIDGLGALVSAFFLGCILVRWEKMFGMPVFVLNYLAIAAVFLAVFSVTCFVRTPKKPRFYLRFIAVVNFVYCCISAVCVIVYFDYLTVSGVLYFVGEIVILGLLIFTELKVAGGERGKREANKIYHG